jgi:predicted nucleic acid-binding protein
MQTYQSTADYYAARCDLALLLIAAASGSQHDAAMAREHTAAIQLATTHSDTALPLVATLATRLGLSSTEDSVLWLLICAELELGVESAFSAKFARGTTAQALIALVYQDHGAAAIQELSDLGRLMQLDLITADISSSTGSPSKRMLRATDRALALALGCCEMDPNIAEIVSEVKCDDRMQYPDIAVGWEPETMSVVVGAGNSGAHGMLLAAAAQQRVTVMQINAAELDLRSEQGQLQLRRIARDASLLEMVPAFCNIDVWMQHDASENNGASESLRRFDQHFLRWAQGPVFATSSKAVPNHFKHRVVINVEVPASSHDSLARTWSSALANIDDNPSLAAIAAQRFRLPAGDILPIVQSAKKLATGQALELCHIQAAIRVQMDERLSRFGKRVNVTQTWDDLVLPSDENHQIAEMFARVEYKDTVFQHWGFAAKVGKGNGLAALLSGPPGTGKTMVAGLIAKDLGLDLYQIDTSKIVSKYIGETEKNLAAVFDAAESGHAILLFDEADSLFGKRTEVKSSNDRNANLETNFLLQRLESFTGLCILTSNHEDAMDPAFKRRLAMHVRLPVPSEAERTMLWSRMIPTAAPLAHDFDPIQLAGAYAMTGGYIKNAVVRAAFYAAVNNRPMMQRDFLLAARLECQAMGKVVRELH